MKKLLCILASILLLMFGLSGCVDIAPAGGTKNGETNTATNETEKDNMQLNLTIGAVVLTATLEDNPATAALKEKLKGAPVTIDMTDYGGFEKIGDFGFDLPTSDGQTTTQPCDFVLYRGNRLVIFYGSNSWSYTCLGKIMGVTPAELKNVLGTGNVSVTLSI